MATKITVPIPQDEIKESFVWRDWFQKLSNRVYGTMAEQDASAVVVTGGVIQATSVTTDTLYVPTGTDGQVLIGKTSDHSFAPATLTAGTNITITNAANSITINSSGSMVYPGAGIPNSTGTAWGTSYSTTGTGTVVALDTSPSFTTPLLGTPTSGVLTTCTGYTYANLAGTIPTWNQNTTGSAASLSATLVATSGGTGQSSYVIGDLLYASTTTALSKLADIATGNALISGGVGAAPSYGKIGLTTHVSGTLPLTSGGSGQITAQLGMDAFAGAVTSGSYLRGNGTNVVMNTIQVADVPTLNQSTTGSAATLTTGRTVSITGDLTYSSGSFNGSANVTAAGTLATVNLNVGSFTNASLTVNGKGLITAASSGTAPVTSVTATSPVASSGGATPAISLSAGYGDTLNPYASKTANFVLAAPTGLAGVPTFRAVVAADIPTLNQNTTGSAATLTTSRTIAITGDLTYTSTSFNGSANVTAAGTLATVNTNVGSFTNSTLTVNGKGLITAASSGTAPVTSVTGTAPVVSSGGVTPAISMAAATTSVNGYLTSTDWTTFNNKGSGTVTAVSVVSANGFAGSSSGGATPALTLSTSITGIIKGNGTAISAATVGTDYSVGTSALATGILRSTTITGALSIAVAADFPTLNQNTTGSAATLTTPRAIYGNNFDGSAALTQIVASTYGGTGNGFTKFSGATTSEKTYSLPDATTTILTTNTAVTAGQGGTGQTTYTVGDILYASATGTLSKLIAGTINYVLTSGGAGVAPSWAASSSGGATISNDTATATNVYPLFAAATSGGLATAYTSNAKLLYKPSTGEFTSSILTADNGIHVNSKTVATSYTIATGYSGMSAGPITIASGQTVTISSGSKWVVL